MTRSFRAGNSHCNGSRTRSQTRQKLLSSCPSSCFRGSCQCSSPWHGLLSLPGGGTRTWGGGAWGGETFPSQRGGYHVGPQPRQLHAVPIHANVPLPRPGPAWFGILLLPQGGPPTGNGGNRRGWENPSTSLYISRVPRTFVRPRFLCQHSTNPTFSPEKLVSENCWPIKKYLLRWFFKITCLSLQEGRYAYKK